MTLFSIFKELSSTSSINEKKDILNNNSGNELLRNAFFYSGNPRFNFYIRVEPFEPLHEGTGRDINAGDFAFLDSLNRREITGNAARKAFEDQTIDMSPGAKCIFHRIINRDLRCNVGNTLANKTWKNMIPEFPVMLCAKMNAKMEKKLLALEGKELFDVSTKEDGGRLIVMVDGEGAISYRSRNGSTLNLFGVFDHLSKFVGCVFDGELLAMNPDGSIAPRKVGNGLYTKAVRGTLSEEESKQLLFITWDIIPYDVYNGVGTSAPLAKRIEQLETCKFDGNNVRRIEHEIVATVEQCREFYLRQRAAGKEGAIIKLLSSFWENDRSDNQIKLKAEDPADLICVGVTEGNGKYAGKIGALLLESSCGKLKVSVGSGLVDSDREKDPSYFIGKIIEINYNELITSKGRDTYSMFLPIFNQIRFDKTVANSLEELQ